MEPYRDWDHDSGIRAFEIGHSQIDVQFKSGAIYRYTAASVGSQNLDKMISLARAGEGLNAFINKVVKQRFAMRIK